MKMARASRQIRVSELFSSIQGEGSHMGYPCCFIRLAGCNLRCRYCDTAYAWEGSGPEVRLLSVGELVEWVQGTGLRLVQVTGGEPLLQSASHDLMDEILRLGLVCLLETNGSISLKGVPTGVVKVVDWKCPGSGHEGSFLLENLKYLGGGDQIKFVITDRRDYEWSLERVKRHCLDQFTQIIFSPAWGRVSPVDLARWLLADAPFVRMQIQLHKLLWGDKKGA